MDKITKERILKLHPAVRDEVMELVELANSKLAKHSEIRVVQGLRTFAEQDVLYSLGRTRINPDGKSARKPKGNIVTNARGGQSIHNYGLAIDFCLLIDGTQISWDLQKDWDGDKVADWMEVVKTFTDAGWEWGGKWKFKDNPHLQKSYGFEWRDLLKMHNEGEIDENGYVIL